MEIAIEGLHVSNINSDGTVEIHNDNSVVSQKVKNEFEEAYNLIGNEYPYKADMLIHGTDIKKLIDKRTMNNDLIIKDLDGGISKRIPSPDAGWTLQTLAVVIQIYTNGLHGVGFDIYLGNKEICSSEL